MSTTHQTIPTQPKPPVERSTDLVERLIKLDESVRLLHAVEGGVEQAYEAIATMAGQLVRADLCDVLMLDPETGFVTYVAAAGRNAKSLRGCRLPIEDAGLCGWVVHHNEPARIDDMRSDPRASQQFLRDMDVNAGLLVPLRDEGRVVGGLSAFRRDEPFDEVDERILHLFSQHVSVVRAHRRLLETLEHRVVERTAELHESNARLDEFARSVAHDLRAPLRSIHGFAEALLEDYGDQLDLPGRDYARRIVRSATRLDELICDLLEYSRLERAELPTEPVDLKLVVEQARSHLAADIQARDAQIDVDTDLPTVAGHFATLVQMTVNLLANAIKFTAPGVRPRVEIRGQRRNGQARLTITDNGIGIRPEDQQRVFEVFERLHGEEAYPGTGIGLALVRRAAARMHGRVGVESEPGKGSTFWIEFASSEASNDEEGRRVADCGEQRRRCDAV